MYSIIDIIEYVIKFEGEYFQGNVSYHRIEKTIILHELFGYYILYGYINKKVTNEHISIERFNNDYDSYFSNVVELNEQGVVDLYLRINKQDCYIRNVKLMCYIVYKEVWFDYSLYNKFLNVKNKVKFLKGINI